MYISTATRLLVGCTSRKCSIYNIFSTKKRKTWRKCVNMKKRFSLPETLLHYRGVLHGGWEKM